MHTTGEKPGSGYYACRNCGRVIHLDAEDDALPACPECGSTEWDKLS